MRYSIIIALLLMSIISSGQNSMPEFLQTIELNNKTLKALRAQTDALKVGNRTGLNPSNPEVEYVYQWGNTDQLDNKQEFHIRQSFDFPAAYRYRKLMTESLNEKAERDYLNAYNIVMLEAQRLTYQLIHQNALLAEYQKRIEHAERFAQAFHIKFDEGDANIMERNKADINLLNARSALAQVQAGQKNAMEQLMRINGGEVVTFEINEWPMVQLPLDYDEWFSANADIMPELQSLQQGLEANRYNEKLNKAMALPKISGGYSAETGAVDKFKGVNFGLTIPLWENKNTVKQAKLNTISLENQMLDTRLQLYHGLKALYVNATQVKVIAADYRESLSMLSNTALLQTALESGEISILEYMMELSIYYEAIENALDAELDYRLNIAQMKAFQVN